MLLELSLQVGLTEYTHTNIGYIINNEYKKSICPWRLVGAIHHVNTGAIIVNQYMS